MATVRTTALALALLIGASALTAGATSPVGTSPNNAPYIDNQTHTIPGNSSIWYRFDYHLSDTGDQPIANVPRWLPIR